ncbi:hypothetical protein [Rhizobium sp. Nf11,1]|uniref:hypothetical protein n=1 Tax=Rhizobium sp. Nf11,1 TaxID=3404923 RepID=UPI003D339F68
MDPKLSASLPSQGIILRSSSKRVRLGFAAGFRGLRNAVPFFRIKAKKIPIVQMKFNISAIKNSLKNFVEQNQWTKKIKFCRRPPLGKWYFFGIVRKTKGNGVSEAR